MSRSFCTAFSHVSYFIHVLFPLLILEDYICTRDIYFNVHLTVGRCVWTLPSSRFLQYRTEAFFSTKDWLVWFFFFLKQVCKPLKNHVSVSNLWMLMDQFVFSSIDILKNTGEPNIKRTAKALGFFYARNCSPFSIRAGIPSKDRFS